MTSSFLVFFYVTFLVGLPRSHKIYYETISFVVTNDPFFRLTGDTEKPSIGETPSFFVTVILVASHRSAASIYLFSKLKFLSDVMTVKLYTNFLQ